MKHLTYLILTGLLVAFLPTRAPADTFTDTYYADDTETFSNLNDKVSQQFSVISGTVSFTFRFVSQYRATAAVISASDLAAFESGASVSTYAVFNDTFGTNPVTLGPGNYAIVVRNDTQGSNTIRYELDYLESLVGGSFVDYYFENEGNVSPNGGKLWQPFTIQQGYRYWVDGANTGVATYITDSTNFALWEAGQTFQYYSDYSAVSDDELPGGYEVALPPGNYYLCFENDSSVNQTVCYTCSRWTNGTSSGSGTGGSSTSGSGGSGGSGSGGSGGSGDLFSGTSTGSNTYQSSWFGTYSYYGYPLIYQYHLGFEYAFYAGGDGVYLYDYTSGHFFYTQASYFPFVYDFSLNTFLYYYQANTPHRHFYDFGTNQVISE